MPRRAVLAAAMLGGIACAEASGPSPIVATLLAPDSISVAEFDSIRIPLTLLDSSGNAVTAAAITWQIGDSTVATVDHTGQLHYRRPGATAAIVFSHGLTHAVQVTAGVRFALMASGSEYYGFTRWCGVTRRGTLYCLQSYIAFSPDSFIPIAAPPSPVRQLSVGYQHVCAVTTDNAGWCWGVNLYGVLGVIDKEVVH